MPQVEGQAVSLSGLDKRCADLFFYWDVFNVFLGAMLGGSIVAELPTYIKDPSIIWSTLGSTIPASSNFFVNYVAVRAGGGVAGAGGGGGSFVDGGLALVVIHLLRAGAGCADPWEICFGLAAEMGPAGAGCTTS